MLYGKKKDFSRICFSAAIFVFKETIFYFKIQLSFKESQTFANFVLNVLLQYAFLRLWWFESYKSLHFLSHSIILFLDFLN